MFLLNRTQERWVLAGLACFMAATRFHHFGSVTFLPDASLAVFFLAGLYLINPFTDAAAASRPHDLARSWGIPLGIFAFLLAEAAVIDYLAVHYGGVSDWCVTAAYPFLIPTYGAMFYAGKRCRSFDLMTAGGALKTAAVLVTATVAAFLISNGSFYVFSGSVTDTTWLAYADGIVRQYFAPYALYTMVYTGLILAAHVAVRALGRESFSRPGTPKSL